MIKSVSQSYCRTGIIMFHLLYIHPMYVKMALPVYKLRCFIDFTELGDVTVNPPVISYKPLDCQSWPTGVYCLCIYAFTLWKFTIRSVHFVKSRFCQVMYQCVLVVEVSSIVTSQL